MRNYFLIALLLVLAGCKKEQPGAEKKDEKKVLNEISDLAVDSVFLKKFDSKVLTDFYEANAFRTFWNKPEKRKAAIDALAEAETKGLNPEDYNLKKIQDYERKINSLSNGAQLSYDIALSQAMQKYFFNLANGKLNPRALYANWDLKEHNIEINKPLIAAIKGDSLPAVIRKIEPQHLVYRRLLKALELINSYPEDDFKPMEFTQKIVLGETGNQIIDIKKRLLYWKDLEAGDSLTSTYDAKTAEAVKKFQKRHGLTPDGVIGKGTVTAFNFSKKQRKEQIIVNLERWRWFPRALGNHYIIVNIPGYNLRVVKDNDTVEKKKVVVGTIKRKTPVLSSTFSNIVLNPTWTVPPTILKEDLTPSATKDRSYFANRDITIYDWKNNVVAPENWNPEKPNNYRYVQSPGDHNSLGNVKFNFPNHFTVYLHDTNHRNYFSKNFRSLSSGCVRVEDPLPLAEYLLNDPENWSAEKINEVIASRETTYIPLKEKVNIHQFYWTAWLNKKAELQFRSDIYNLDADLYEKLRK